MIHTLVALPQGIEDINIVGGGNFATVIYNSIIFMQKIFEIYMLVY